VFTAQLLAGAAAVCASVLMLVPLGSVTVAPLSDELRSTVWPTHWKYARWSGSTGAATWFNAYVYYLALPVWGGLAATGGLRALTNLIMPLLQSDSALATLLVPVLVRSRSNAERFKRIVTWSAAAFALEALVYWFVLVLAGQQVLAWLYGGIYQFDISVLALLGMLPLSAGVLNVLGAALLAREQPEKLFWATLASALVAGTLGVAAVANYGVAGAVLGSVCGTTTQVMVMLWFLTRPDPATHRASVASS
jgi:O-antigen/teichoic acid export membrane protein